MTEPVIHIRDLKDEIIGDYKETAMYIASSHCNWKCCLEAGIPISVCQNSPLATKPIIPYPIEKLYSRYINNGLTKAIIIAGLEPLNQCGEVIELIHFFRERNCNDPFIIYTGYTEAECMEMTRFFELTSLRNIIIKYGRYVPNDKPRYDKILGITLVSSNQHARQY